MGLHRLLTAEGDESHGSWASMALLPVLLQNETAAKAQMRYSFATEGDAKQVLCEPRSLLELCAAENGLTQAERLKLIERTQKLQIISARRNHQLQVGLLLEVQQKLDALLASKSQTPVSSVSSEGKRFDASDMIVAIIALESSKANLEGWGCCVSMKNAEVATFLKARAVELDLPPHSVTFKQGFGELSGQGCIGCSVKRKPKFEVFFSEVYF